MIVVLKQGVSREKRAELINWLKGMGISDVHISEVSAEKGSAPAAVPTAQKVEQQPAEKQAPAAAPAKQQAPAAAPAKQEAKPAASKAPAAPAPAKSDAGDWE